jgi:hypothetical protein
MSAGRTDQCGEHKCDGDKHNNQSNDDYHVDTSDSDSIFIRRHRLRYVNDVGVHRGQTSYSRRAPLCSSLLRL